MLSWKRVLVCGLIALPVPVTAQEVESVEAGLQAQAGAEQSDLPNILMRLSEKHRFSISGLSHLQGSPSSAALSGDLAADLQRLLRNTNFVLTYATANGKSTIERVTIINAQFGSKKPAEQVRLPDKDALQSFAVTP